MRMDMLGHGWGVWGTIAQSQTASKQHYEMAKKLGFLRKNGILIIGSGNIVHNLRMINWNKDVKPYNWAIEFNDSVKKAIQDNNYDKIIDYIISF